MLRMRKILFALCALILLSWMGSAVENSSAHPSGHAHKHISSHSTGHQHNDENTEGGKFYCPMHKHRSLMPCPHKHSQKEMAHPKQCKIGPECGGSPVKSVPINFSFDHNPVLMTDSFPLDLPGLIRADSSLPVDYDDPPLNSQKHPPKSL
jgi:hypothetical protein